MARIERRGNSYRFIAYDGYNLDGKQITYKMTWKPDPSMTKKQAYKEALHQAELFDEKVRKGIFLDGSVKFADFAERWFSEYAATQIRATTIQRYRKLLPRINAAIGHMKLEKIQPQHLLSFYQNLAEIGIRTDTKYKTTGDLLALIKARKRSMKSISDESGISINTVYTAVHGKNVEKETAEKISAALDEPLTALFAPVDPDRTLSGSTIHKHHELISSILGTAVEWQILFANPCERVKPPKIGKPEPKYLDEVQARELLALLEDEAPQFRIIVTVLMFTGLRRGELLGLKWEDVDLDTGIINVKRNLLYLPDKGTFEDETKTATSRRSIRIPAGVCDLFKEQKTLQAARRLKLGDQWQNSGYIFTAWNGAALNPTTLTSSFDRFRKKHDLTGITLHGLRHTNATLLIANGVPLTTVAQRLGHVNASTTTKIYAHAIQSADAAAAQVLDDLLTPAAVRHG
jgi:integrase